MSVRLRLAGVAALLLASPLAMAQEPGPRAEVWDLRLGTPVADLPHRFIEYACGTNGGPPSRPLRGFSEYAMCRPDARGLYEVYFRYEDEIEYLARAREQVNLIDRYAGTRVFGYPAVVSALFDAAGILRGIRIATDPRGVPPEQRSDFWTLGTVLRSHFGEDGWTCTDLPPGLDERPVATFFVKDMCTKTEGGLELRVDRAYYHRRGQHFMDEVTRVVEPESFESRTLFEMYAL